MILFVLDVLPPLFYIRLILKQVLIISRTSVVRPVESPGLLQCLRPARPISWKPFGGRCYEQGRTLSHQECHDHCQSHFQCHRGCGGHPPGPDLINHLWGAAPAYGADQLVVHPPLHAFASGPVIDL